MYQPPSPDEFNFNPQISEDETSKLNNLLEKSQAENISVKNVLARQAQLKRLFLWLIGIGLGLGVVVSLIVVIAITKLGLAKKPYEIEKQPIPETIQENQNSLEGLQGIEQQ